MSQKPPPPKSNFMQMLLIFAMVWLGFSMFNTLRNAPTETRSPNDIMAAIRKQADLVEETASKNNMGIGPAITMLSQQADERKAPLIPDLLQPHEQLSADQDLEHLRILNRLICDMSAPKIEAVYESRISELKTLSSTQKDDLKLQAEMIVVDTQLKAADARHEINRLTLANDTITRLGRFDDTKPIWNQPVQVAPTKNYSSVEVTPAQLAQEIGSLSTMLGKTSPVFGFFPGYQLVDFIVHLTGAIPGFSYWFTGLLMAILVRAIVFPISQRQMMWSRQMQQLTPLINEIKEEYKNKPNSQQEVQTKTMKLYQEYGMNPLSGCLPALLQVPLFSLIYYSMLNYRFEFQKGTFLWINPTTSALSHGFLARNLGEKDYVLIVVYAISMVTTALLTPVTDPSNMRQQRLMGVSVSGLFGIMMFFWPVPSAFIFYWICTNILATAQSLRAYRLPLPPLVKKNAPNGGVYPITGGKFGPPQAPGRNGKAEGKLNGKPKSTGAPKIHKPKKKK